MNRYDVRLINFGNSLVGTYHTIGEALERARKVGFEAAIYDERGMFVTSFRPIGGQSSMTVAEAIRMGGLA